jgi:hypothetical protein
LFTQADPSRQQVSRARIGFILLVLTLGSGLSLAQNPKLPLPATTDASFEELPELKASEILQPDILKGPYHTVREPVPTFSGTNQFIIDSQFGLFEADGNEMLLRRVKEVYAIAQLKDVSRTDQFKNALVTAAKSPLAAAKKIVEDPVEAISNVPKGVMKFFGKAKNTIKNAGKKKDEDTDAEGSKMQQALGFSKAKREIALNMGIDPYSTNPVLIKELEEIAWASWAGGFAFSAATFPIGGPAGMALTATNVTSSADRMLREKTPEDLKAINRRALVAMGASGKSADRILSNGAFTPTHATAFTLNLQSLDHVADRGAFIRSAAENSSNETDAVFCVQTARLMSQMNSGDTPLARIVMIGDFPVCIAKDGKVIVALQWDYAAWTPAAASFVPEVQKLATENGNHGVRVALSGDASVRLKQELQSRGIVLQEKATPGPLK